MFFRSFKGNFSLDDKDELLMRHLETEKDGFVASIFDLNQKIRDKAGDYISVFVSKYDKKMSE